MVTRNNSIARELVIKAPRDRVWKAIVDPDTMAKWFFNGWRGDWKVGSLVWFLFEGYGEVPAILTHLGGDRLSFRWNRLDPTTENPNLDDLALDVTFEAENHPDGTLLKVHESGYERLSDADYANDYPDHEQGWTSELAELVAWAESAS